VASVLFYQNQKNYESKLSAKQWEISKIKISNLESKHFDLRNKFVQFNNADKYGLAISDLFLECLKKINASENSKQGFSNLYSIDHLQLFIQEKKILKLKSVDSILAYLLDMFETIVNQEINQYPYKSEFTLIIENLEEYDNELNFNITPFESFHIPENQLTVTLYGEILKTNSAPSEFCFEPSNVDFQSKFGSRFLIDNVDHFTWP